MIYVRRRWRRWSAGLCMFTCCGIVQRPRQAREITAVAVIGQMFCTNHPLRRRPPLSNYSAAQRRDGGGASAANCRYYSRLTLCLCILAGRETSVTMEIVRVNLNHKIPKLKTFVCFLHWRRAFIIVALKFDFGKKKKTFLFWHPGRR